MLVARTLPIPTTLFTGVNVVDDCRGIFEYKL